MPATVPATPADLAALSAAAGGAAAELGQVGTEASALGLTTHQRDAAGAWITAGKPGGPVTFITKDPYINVATPAAGPVLSSVLVSLPLADVASVAPGLGGTGTIFLGLLDVNYQTEAPYQAFYQRTYLETANTGMLIEEEAMQGRFMWPTATTPTAVTFSLSSCDTQANRALANHSLYKGSLIDGAAGYNSSTVPPWWRPASGIIVDAASATAALQTLINGTVGHYVTNFGTAASGKGVTVWNAVNESIKFNAFQDNPFNHFLPGSDATNGYIRLALNLVLANDPSALVLLNFNHVELDSDAPNWAIVIAFVQALKAAGFPMGSLIIAFEGHLNASAGAGAYTQFASRCNAVTAAGALWAVSEHDVNDDTVEQTAHAQPGPEFPATYAARDNTHQAVTAQFLAAARTANVRPHHWGVWGEANQISWLNNPPNPGSPDLRSDGQRGRVTLLDESWKETSAYYAVRQGLANLRTLNPGTLPVTANMSPGRTQWYQATPLDAGGNVYTGPVTYLWGTGNTGVATIDSAQGILTPVGNGVTSVFCKVTPATGPAITGTLATGVSCTGFATSTTPNRPSGLLTVLDTGDMSDLVLPSSPVRGTTFVTGGPTPGTLLYLSPGQGVDDTPANLTLAKNAVVDGGRFGLRVTFPVGKASDPAVCLQQVYSGAQQGTNAFYFAYDIRLQAGFSLASFAANAMKIGNPKDRGGNDNIMMAFLGFKSGAGAPASGFYGGAGIQGPVTVNVPNNNAVPPQTDQGGLSYFAAGSVARFEHLWVSDKPFGAGNGTWNLWCNRVPAGAATLKLESSGATPGFASMVWYIARAITGGNPTAPAWVDTNNWVIATGTL